MIVYGTRGSDLALTQTRHVAETVRAATGEDFRLEIIKTRGDAIVDRPLPEVGGKGLFTAELETALRDGRIDVAVHSLKDLPVEDPDGLTLGAIPVRAPVHDVLVFDPRHQDDEAGTLPIGDRLRIGTSSPRRARAIETLRKDLDIADVRGNVPTRADKVRRGDYAAVILAAAGMQRLQLDLDGLRRAELPTDRFVPAPGQGALGVQCRRDDERIRGLLAAIHDDETARCVTAERSILARLEGGCSTPLGALIERLDDGRFRLRAGLYNQHGRPAHRVLCELFGDDPERLAATAIERLLPIAHEPLQGRTVCLVRPGGADPALAAELAVAGAQVETVALTEVLPMMPTTAQLDAAWSADAFLVTSARSVDRLFEEAAAAGVDLSERRFFAVGPRTAAAVIERGGRAESPAHPAGGAELADHILATLDGSPRRFALPGALELRPELKAKLTDAGHQVDHLPLYRIEALAGVEWPVSRADALVWTSPSSVHAGVDLGNLPRVDAHVAIGTTTTQALADAALSPSRSAQSPTPPAVLAAVVAALETGATGETRS